MPFAVSKVTAQGQISVPAEVRKKLGVGPGSTLEWTEENGKVVITRGGRFNFNDVRTALFGAKSPKARMSCRSSHSRISTYWPRNIQFRMVKTAEVPRGAQKSSERCRNEAKTSALPSGYTLLT